MYYSPNRFYSSPWNFRPDVMANYALPKVITIYDSTVRKILMTPGVSASADELLEIADLAYGAGLSRCFLNVHWWGAATPEPLAFEVAQRVLHGVPVGATLFSDVFATERWLQGVDTLAEMGAKEVQIAIPLADCDGSLRPGIDTGAAVDRLLSVIAAFRERDVAPVAGILDIGRVDLPAVEAYLSAAAQAGCARFDLSDSSSCLSFDAMRAFILHVSNLAPSVELTMHVHNDCGLASAACIASVTAGAHPDVSSCGISYRSGFASLEAVAASLISLYGCEIPLQWDVVQALAQRVGGLLPGDALRGVTGLHSFVKESPTSVRKYLVAPTLPPASPDSVLSAEGFGSHTRLVWGRQTLADIETLRAKADAMGVNISGVQLQQLRQDLNSELRQKDSYPAWFTEDQISTRLLAVARGDYK